MGSQAAASQTSTGLPYFVWDAPGKGVSVHLHFDVIDRMLPEIMRGFGALPRRGAEVGGVLLGRMREDGGERLVTVEDFVPVPCEYLTGPSYHLSARDRERLEAVLAEEHGGAVVGFFRSHTRKDLFLDDADLDLANRYFQDPRQVCLLIKPFATRPSLGGFFFWEDGGITREKTYREFPFNRNELGGGMPDPEPVRSPEPAPARPVRPQGPLGAGAAPPLQPPDNHAYPGLLPVEDEYDRRARQRQMMERARGQRPGLAAVPLPEGRLEELTAAAMPEPQARAGSLLNPPEAPARRGYAWLAVPILLAMSGMAYVVWDWSWVAPPQETPAMAPAMPLQLIVQDVDGQLDIGWNTAAAAIQGAQRGVLVIEDGGTRREIELTADQLHNDRVYYSRVSGDVSLRLEVFANERTSVAESVRFAGPPPPGKAPEVTPKAEEAPPAAAEPPPQRARRAPARRTAQRNAPVREVSEAPQPPPAPVAEPEPPAREIPKPTRRR
ncbi:MAG: hypothetical protein IPM24_18185 [Bryobacterales bacterium]|nr:hypothetical protein [Bryobacterales bacterium]